MKPNFLKACALIASRRLYMYYAESSQPVKTVLHARILKKNHILKACARIFSSTKWRLG
jgi:hypothetical protein